MLEFNKDKKEDSTMNRLFLIYSFQTKFNINIENYFFLILLFKPLQNF